MPASIHIHDAACKLLSLAGARFVRQIRHGTIFFYSFCSFRWSLKERLTEKKGKKWTRAIMQPDDVTIDRQMAWSGLWRGSRFRFYITTSPPSVCVCVDIGLTSQCQVIFSPFFLLLLSPSLLITLDPPPLALYHVRFKRRYAKEFAKKCHSIGAGIPVIKIIECGVSVKMK